MTINRLTRALVQCASLLLPVAGANAVETTAGVAGVAATPSPDTVLLERIHRAVDQADRAVEQGRGAVVNVDRMPVPASPAVPLEKIDAEALARRLSTLTGRPPASATPGLYAFISFSMPRSSLERLVADAQTYGATLVLRGLVGRSLKKTAQTAQGLIGERKVGWLIDPQAFLRFGVRSVPSYVLVRSGATTQACAWRECFNEQDYVRLAGDVSLRYAIEKMGEAAPQFAQDAAWLIDQEVRR
jgi:conjugal transfer pilus assembly protein TrbC